MVERGNQLCNLKGGCHREPGNGAAFPLQMRKIASTVRDYHHHPVFLGGKLSGNKLYVNRRVGNRGKGMNTKSIKRIFSNTVSYSLNGQIC